MGRLERIDDLGGVNQEVPKYNIQLILTLKP